MPTFSQTRDFCVALRDDTLREIAASKSYLREIWDLSLSDRVAQGHALGPLKVLSQRGAMVTLEHESAQSQDSFSRLREGDMVRLSRNDPQAGGSSGFFHSDDGERITLEMSSNDELPFDLPLTGLTLDPDFYDPTERFMAALDGLQGTDHGSKVVLPILMGEGETETSLADHENALDDLEESDDLLPEEERSHYSQHEAVAQCVSASRFHLVQGPPGTGKTHVLATVVAKLVEQGQRVLLTGPTHRSIDHALKACRSRITNNAVPVVKISRVNFDPLSSVAHCEKLAEAQLPFDEPFVLGATTLNLWSTSSGLMGQDFDTVVLDESSQLTMMLALLAMLRADRFLFFGDHCQLPPVRLAFPNGAALDDSIFSKLRKSASTTMLTESWRLNRDLVEWPSAAFYGNQLTARHDLQLELSPASENPALKKKPGFYSLVHGEENSSTRSSEEAERVAELILELLKGGKRPAEIAVVTPFRAQAALIRRMLRTRQEFLPWPVAELVVDTVERLQGQEREVILVSFAASREAFILRLEGFLFDPRRLNVAITRARSKTVLLCSKALLEVAESLAESGSSGAAKFCSLLGK